MMFGRQIVIIASCLLGFGCSYEDVESERFQDQLTASEREAEQSQFQRVSSQDFSSQIHSGQNWQFAATYDSPNQYEYLALNGEFLRARSFRSSGLTDADSILIERVNGLDRFSPFVKVSLPVAQASGALLRDAIVSFNDRIYWVLQKRGDAMKSGSEEDQYFMLSSSDGKNWQKLSDPFLNTACEKAGNRDLMQGFSDGKALFFTCKGQNDMVTVQSSDGKLFSEMAASSHEVDLVYDGKYWRVNDQGELLQRLPEASDWRRVKVSDPFILANQVGQISGVVLKDLLFVEGPVIYALVEDHRGTQSERQIWRSRP